MNQENLFSSPATSQRGSWKPPESLPEIRGKFDRVGFDCEATGKNKHKDLPCGYAIHLPDGRSLYLPKRHLGGGNLDSRLVDRWLTTELRGVTLVGLNIGFDAELATRDGIDLEAHGCRLRDVAHAAALLNENRYGGFNLSDLGNEYVGRKKVECPVPPSDIHKVHSSLIGNYAEGDAALAFDVDTVEQEQIAKEGLGQVQELEDELIWVNNHMERSGARIDRPKLESWVKEARQRQGDLILEVWRQTGIRVNPNSAASVMQVLTYLGVKNPNTTAQGDASVTNEYLKTLDHPVPQMILKARQINGLRSKYLDKYLKLLDGDILRFHLYQLRAGEDDYGTISGRYSSANVNIQQVFKVERQVENFGDEYTIRELFIPDDGMDMFAGDAAQIEFRLFAHYANSKKLLDAYRADPYKDFHQLVADMLRQSRTKAKGNNFGKIYGMGRPKLARQLGLACTCGCPSFDFWNNDCHAQGCPAIEANEIADHYDSEFPEAKTLMNKAMNLAGSRGYVKTLLGRVARFPQKERLHSALNRVIQGSAADLFKKKLLRLYRERKTIGIHKLRLPVHDEEVGDIIRDPLARRRLAECFAEQEIELRVPILWDIEFGSNWRECA